MVHPVQLGEAALLARVTGEGEDSPRKLPAHGTEHVSKLRSPIDPRVLFLLLSCSSHEDLRMDRVWAFFSSGFPGGLKKCLGACVVHKLQIWDNLEVKLSSGTDAGRVIPNLGRSHHLHSLLQERDFLIQDYKHAQSHLYAHTLYATEVICVHECKTCAQPIHHRDFSSIPHSIVPSYDFI